MRGFSQRICWISVTHAVGTQDFATMIMNTLLITAPKYSYRIFDFISLTLLVKKNPCKHGSTCFPVNAWIWKHLNPSEFKCECPPSLLGKVCDIGEYSLVTWTQRICNPSGGRGYPTTFWSGTVHLEIQSDTCWFAKFGQTRYPPRKKKWYHFTYPH